MFANIRPPQIEQMQLWSTKWLRMLLSSLREQFNDFQKK